MGVSPHPFTIQLALSRILSKNIRFLVSKLSTSCEGPICIKGEALSCLAQTAALSKCRVLFQWIRAQETVQLIVSGTKGPFRAFSFPLQICTQKGTPEPDITDLQSLILQVGVGQ